MQQFGRDGVRKQFPITVKYAVFTTGMANFNPPGGHTIPKD
jgi:hypothetical protein